MDQLMLFSTDSTVRTHSFGVRPLIIFVVPLFAERGVRCFCQRKNALALHLGAGGKPGKIKKRRRKIYIQGHLITNCAGGDAFWITDHEWNTDRRLVHQTLVEESPLAEEISVIGRMDDSRVIQNIFLFEIVENAPDI